MSKRKLLASASGSFDDEEDTNQWGGEESDNDSDASGGGKAGGNMKDKKNKNKKSKKNESSVPTFTAKDLSEASSGAGLARGLYKNKQRVLVLSSRGIIARYRHLLEDLKKLLPHHKKDNKLDTKGDIHVVNEIAELKSCNNVIYLETRKHQDLYMYVSKTPHGPSVKFHVVNIHTTDELKLTGNCMLGSRPLLNFDAEFDRRPHLQVLKGILTDTFGTPKGHPKSKPFVDRVMSFFVVKNNIWVRNYQIVDKSERIAKSADGVSGAGGGKGNDTHLVEIGPRMVLIPIRIFSGSMSGATLYQNPTYVSPNEERANVKKTKGDSYVERLKSQKERAEYLTTIRPEPDPLANVFKMKK